MTQNIMICKTLSGEYMVINQHLVAVLVALDIYTEGVWQTIVRDNGSVQGVKELPDEYKRLFKTAWEIDPQEHIDLAVGRAPFVDQSSSQNVFMLNASPNRAWTYHAESWKEGLKTSTYYFHVRPKASAIKVMIDPKFPPPPPNIRAVSVLEGGEEEECLNCQA